MRADSYVKVVLTIIALELGWLGAKEAAVPLTAQSAATPVVITGIQLNDTEGAHLPVVVLGVSRQIPAPLSQTVDRLTIRLAVPDQPLKVEMDKPVKVEADKPLPVDQVRFTPGARPGE